MEPARVARVVKAQLMRRLDGYEDEVIRHPAVRTYHWFQQKGGKPPTIKLEVSDIEIGEAETVFMLRVTENDGGENQESRLDGIVSALLDWRGCTIRHPEHFAGGFDMRLSVRTDVLIPLLRKLKGYKPTVRG